MAKKTAKVTEEAKATEQATTNAVATQENKDVQVSGEAGNVANWGTGGVSSQDIIIPRILLLQPMSQMVTNGEGVFGEFRESLAQEVIAAVDDSFDVIPFHMEKVWIEFNVEDPNDKKFLRTVPIVPANEQLPYNYEYKDDKTGKTLKGMRDRTMNFYVLRPSELDAGSALPYIISCRRSSLQAGKKIATQMYVKNTASGKTPAATVMSMSASKTTNDKKQTYAVMDAKPVRPAKQEHIVEAFKWFQLIQSGKAKAHEESYSEEARGEGFEGGGNAGGQAQPQASGPSRF